MFLCQNSDVKFISTVDLHDDCPCCSIWLTVRKYLSISCLLTTSWWPHAVVFPFSSAGARTHSAACAFLHPPVERSKSQALSLCCCPSTTTLIASSRQIEVHLLTLNTRVPVFGWEPRQPYLPQAWKNHRPSGFYWVSSFCFCSFFSTWNLSFWAWNFSCEMKLQLFL